MHQSVQTSPTHGDIKAACERYGFGRTTAYELLRDQKIRDLVTLQLPGVTLHPLPVAPRQIPFHTGASYFELETRNSDLWHQLEKSGGVAMHIAGEFPGLELAFWAIRS